jgi:hypothetical protein
MMACSLIVVIHETLQLTLRQLRGALLGKRFPLNSACGLVCVIAGRCRDMGGLLMWLVEQGQCFQLASVMTVVILGWN